MKGILYFVVFYWSVWVLNNPHDPISTAMANVSLGMIFGTLYAWYYMIQRVKLYIETMDLIAK